MYLGKTVKQDGELLPEINKRIALGWAAFGKVENIMKSRKSSMKIKRRLFNECILSVMTYGSETWTSEQAHHRQISWHNTRWRE